MTIESDIEKVERVLDSLKTMGVTYKVEVSITCKGKVLEATKVVSITHKIFKKEAHGWGTILMLLNPDPNKG